MRDIKVAVWGLEDDDDISPKEARALIKELEDVINERTAQQTKIDAKSVQVPQEIEDR